MRHDGRVLDQALHAAQALGQREDLAALQQPAGARSVRPRGRCSTIAAAGVHLPARQCVLRMAGEAGIDAPGGCPCARPAMAAIASAFSQCRSMRSASVFTPRKARKLSKGALIAADRVLQEAEPLGECVVVADDRDAADHVRMAVEVLRDRVHDDVESQCRAAAGCTAWRTCCRPPRACLCWRATCAIAARSASFSSGLVGVSIHIIRVFGLIAASNAPRFATDRRSVKSRCRAATGARARTAGSAAVDIVAHHHVRAGLQQFQHRGDRRQAGGKRKAGGAFFEVGHAALEGEPRGVVGAAVVEPLCTPGDCCT